MGCNAWDGRRGPADGRGCGGAGRTRRGRGGGARVWNGMGYQFRRHRPKWEALWQWQWQADCLPGPGPCPCPSPARRARPAAASLLSPLSRSLCSLLAVSLSVIQLRSRQEVNLLLVNRTLSSQLLNLETEKRGWRASEAAACSGLPQPHRSRFSLSYPASPSFLCRPSLSSLALLSSLFSPSSHSCQSPIPLFRLFPIMFPFLFFVSHIR